MCSGNPAGLPIRATNPATRARSLGSVERKAGYIAPEEQANGKCEINKMRTPSLFMHDNFRQILQRRLRNHAKNSRHRLLMQPFDLQRQNVLAT
jgi:hypothetical protein